MWLVAFIALVGILLVFDRVAHADVAPPPIDQVSDDPDDADDRIAATIDDVDDGDAVADGDGDGDADDVRAAAELVRLVNPSWIAELAEGERLDEDARHTRPSRFGRLDVALAWRHADRDPRTLEPYGADAVFLVATWRR